MAQNELHEALYQKMVAEQDTYREWLLTRPPEEILIHAHDYATRQDILLAMENNELDSREAEALLRSHTPLTDVLMNWETVANLNLDNIWETIYQMADREADKADKMRLEQQKDSTIFEYQGYHFKPIGYFPANEGFFSLSRKLWRGPLAKPYMTADSSKGIPYSIEDFYSASHNCNADVFRCLETDGVFTPGQEVLFAYTGEYTPYSPEPQKEEPEDNFEMEM